MFENSWQIGKVMGIPIRLHVSWFVIFALITFLLATQYFPSAAPELTPAADWLLSVLAALLLFISVVVHELSHSLIAKRNNIPIASITLFIFGGVAQMKQEPSSPEAEFRMALAGPVSSYVLALFFLAVYKLFGDHPGFGALAYYLCYLNIVLGTFNLIPGFPMDGGRILRAFFWKRSGNYMNATKIASRTGQAIAMSFILLGIISVLTVSLDGLWIVILGWFLYRAAQTSYQHAVAKGILSRLRVRDFMSQEIVTVSSSSSLSEVVDNYFLKYGYGGFPVMEWGRPIGIISLKDVKAVPKDRWESAGVKEVMQAFDGSLAVSESDDIAMVLERMIQEDKSRFLVMNNSGLTGIITRSGIARYLRLKGELGD